MHKVTSTMLALGWTVHFMNAATVAYIDLPGSGIEMLPGSSQDFADALMGLADASTVSLLQPIRPFSVIVKNQSPLALRMVVIRLDLKDAAGKTVWHEASLQAKILPGEMALITPVGGLNVPMRPHSLGSPPIHNPADLKAELLKRAGQYETQSAVTVSLDSVVFEDGSVEGPDTIHNIERMNTWRDADRSVVTELLNLKPAERTPYLEAIKNAPEKAARRPEDVDQLDFRRRSTADLMGMYINALPNEADLRANLDDFLGSQIPQLHRRDK